MSTFPQDLENFCTRFAAGAGSQWRWAVLPDHCLRMENVGRLHCPLMAQLILETGDQFHNAAHLEGYRLDPLTMQVVIHAANDTWQKNPLVRAVRQRLLTICGLEDTAWPGCVCVGCVQQRLLATGGVEEQ